MRQISRGLDIQSCTVPRKGPEQDSKVSTALNYGTFPKFLLTSLPWMVQGMLTLPRSTIKTVTNKARLNPWALEANLKQFHLSKHRKQKSIKSCMYSKGSVEYAQAEGTSNRSCWNHP